METPIQNPEIACNVCGAQSAMHFMHKNGHDIFTCISCGLKFVHPIPSSAEIYNEDYFSGAQQGFGYVDYDEDKQAMVPVFESYMRRIVGLRPSRGTLFDVGAATGFFLEIARRFGFDVSGVEIAGFAASVAREKGINVITGTLADTTGMADKFDVVTMLDVIEHVADPAADLRRAQKILKRGGLLILNTPDVGSVYARILGTRWHLIVPPEHLYYFNRQTMRRVLEESGYRVISISTIGKKFTLPYIFKTLYAWQKFALWRIISKWTQGNWLRNVALPINLHDNMFVVAEKT